MLNRYSDLCTSAVFGRGRGFGVILGSRILLKNKNLKEREREPEAERERNKNKNFIRNNYTSAPYYLFPFQSAHPSLLTLL